MTPAGVLAVLRARLEGSMGQLKAHFSGMDDRGDGVLDKEEFRWGLSDFGLSLTEDEFNVVMFVFDKNGDGVVSFKEFVGELEAGMEQETKK
jgi:Ca2+-binding EF-hand superfamily protein